MSNSTKITRSPYYGKSCINSGAKIRNRWLTLFGIFFVLPALFGLPFVFKMVASGDGAYLLVFLCVFSFSLYVNMRVMKRISDESDTLLRHYISVKPNTDFSNDYNSILANHIRSLNKMYIRSGKSSVSQDSLVEILHAKLKNEEGMVVLFSNLMITLGLVGTISGLITTVGGIGGSGSVLSGISSAIGGMGTAFYTTLLGSMLGGITLRVLHFYVDKEIDAFVLNLAEIVEIRIIPYFRKSDKEKEYRNIAISTLNVLKEMGFIERDEDEIQSIRRSA